MCKNIQIFKKLATRCAYLIIESERKATGRNLKTKFAVPVSQVSAIRFYEKRTSVLTN